MRKNLSFVSAIALTLFVNTNCQKSANSERPNIILIMTDDQGWGQTGYYNHPILKTPNLDAMAESGIRFDRFYAGAPICSPTRASVLTGRNNDRTGVYTHGNALRKQEKTIAEALKQRGYATGHFGKWHINGLVGPGVPILADDPYGPGVFGFDEWVSVTNFFDIDPLMSDNGKFKEYEGTSSDVIVDLALGFIGKSIENKKPFFAVIWDGSPHDPFLALEKDMEGFDDLDEKSRNHYGELVAFDRSVGTLRKNLRDLGVAENTLIWYCSDNGGLPNITPSTVRNLKGFKGSLWEGGLRVPAIVEWPAKIKPSVSNYPASTMDIFPTIADLLNLPDSVMIYPQDGQSINPVFMGSTNKRQIPIPFRHNKGGAMIDDGFKLYIADRNSGKYQLYNLAGDPKETTDVSAKYPEKFEELKNRFTDFDASVEKSIEGKDYPEGKLTDKPYRQGWMTDPRYRQYLDDWVKRPEYRDRIIRENNWDEK